MCGLVTLFQPDRIFNQDLLTAMGNDIIHRGPDSAGYLNEKGLAGVFRRLSILDTSINADQPMTINKISIFFNGEIYNYKKLKTELELKGIHFKSTGDTEVVLRGYEIFGERIFNLLEGMFSIVIINRLSGKVVVARDPLGIKPLYIFRKGSFTGIASEIRPILRLCKPDVDINALKELMVFGWAAGKMSNYKNIEEVSPGSMIKIDLKSGKLKEDKYFDLMKISKENNFINEDVIENQINKSILDHTISDVGYTLQLSGGLDSSYISAICSKEKKVKLKAFSINFNEEKFDEAKYQEMISQKFNLDLYMNKFSGKDYVDELPKAIESMEGPTPHGGCVAIKFLSKKISKFCKVTLTGEGADELFGGYNRYSQWRSLAFKETVSRLLPNFLVPSIYPFKKIKQFIGVNAACYSSVYFDYKQIWNSMPEMFPVPGEREKVSSNFEDFLTRLSFVDQTSYLSSVLTRQDKMSMSHSIESRVPFTHIPLSKLFNQIPNNQRYQVNNSKNLLKKFSKKYFEDDFIYRRKNGLVMPYEKWYSDNQLFGDFFNLLENSSSKIKEYCDEKRFNNLLTNSRKDIKKNLGLLRRLIEIELWLRSINVPNGPLLKI